MDTATDTLPRFARPNGRTQWHLLDKQGDPRCGVIIGKPSHWDFAAEFDDPQQYNFLCRHCLAPKSPSQMQRVAALREARRRGLEGMPNIPRDWRYKDITTEQEMALLRAGVQKREMQTHNRAWAAEELFRRTGRIEP